MKKQTLVIILLAVLVVCCLALVACTGPEGPIGPQGPQGNPGQDGTNGITPQLKIGEDNYWYVSYDNGATWTSLGVKATGSGSAQENHTWEKLYTLIEPGCATEGKYLYSCVDCSLVRVVTTSATGDHSYKETVVAPNCTYQGYTLHTCDGCGDNYKDTFTDIDEDNHFDANNDGLCDNCQIAFVKVTGEYAYDDPWTPGAKYGVKVEVTVLGDIIINVTVTSTDSDMYTNISSSWYDKAKWENGQAAFLASFVGKTVAEVKAIVVDCAVNGFPNSVTGFTGVIGATQSSGRTILAIQDALSKLDA